MLLHYEGTVCRFDTSRVCHLPAADCQISTDVCLQLYETDAAKVASQLQAYCMAGLAPNAACSDLVAKVRSSASVNKGKRAAFICDALGLCNMDSIAATSAGRCVLTATTIPLVTTTSTLVMLSSGTLDYCTAEGLPSGTVLPGVAATASYLPSGTCGEYEHQQVSSCDMCSY